MQSFRGFLTFLLAIFSVVEAIDSFFETFSDEKSQVSFPTVYVDPSGSGQFTTVQAAIDSVPSNNNNWIRISIKSGTYWEKVRIPYDKPFIYLQGSGMEQTKVSWSDHESIETSSTFTSFPDNIVVSGITFVNSYNYPPGASSNPIQAAVAGNLQGDKYVFHECGFIGFQDTLWDVGGRHYFKSCLIQGAVDFIFGSGQSLYEGCTLSVVAGPLSGVQGYITAQGRSSPDEPNGFVFKGCNIIGTGMAYLGRPWRPYARVVFSDTDMSQVVLPQGWDPWNSVGNEYKLTYDEHNCRGPGSDTSRRVKWSNKLNEDEVNKLVSMSFVDSEGWIQSWMLE